MPLCTVLLLMCMASASSCSVGSFSPTASSPERIMSCSFVSNSSLMVGALMASNFMCLPPWWL